MCRCSLSWGLQTRSVTGKQQCTWQPPQAVHVCHEGAEKLPAASRVMRRARRKAWWARMWFRFTLWWQRKVLLRKHVMDANVLDKSKGARTPYHRYAAAPACLGIVPGL